MAGLAAVDMCLLCCWCKGKCIPYVSQHSHLPPTIVDVPYNECMVLYRPPSFLSFVSCCRFKAYVRRIELDQWDTDAWTGLVKEAQNNRGGGMTLKDILRCVCKYQVRGRVPQGRFKVRTFQVRGRVPQGLVKVQ